MIMTKAAQRDLVAKHYGTWNFEKQRGGAKENLEPKEIFAKSEIG
jgi:hypothetical protein